LYNPTVEILVFEALKHPYVLKNRVTIGKSLILTVEIP